MNKRIIFISVVCIMAALPVEAQNSKHTYKMGPLTWNDFVHKNAIDNQVSYMEYYMGYAESSKEVDGVTYRKPSVYAYMAPGFSWADTNYRTPELLQYNQCIFDLLELYRRQLEGGLSGLAIGESRQMLDNTMRRLDEDIYRMGKETNQGSDTAELHRWQRQLAAELDSVKADAYGYEDAKFRWGSFLGFGYTNTLGEVHNHFGGSFEFYWDLDLGWNRHFVKSGMTIGAGHANGYSYDPDHIASTDPVTGIVTYDPEWALWPKDGLIHFGWYALYGYSVVDNTKYRITPFVGYGLQYYGLDEDDSSVGFGSGQLHFGVDFDKHLSNVVAKWGYDGYFNAEHTLFDLDVKLYGTYGRYNGIAGTPAGFSINLQVGIGFMQGAAHCK